ncbi:hypothetical protein BHE90_002113 [Fusarium euwallaceae]|uniref:C2H2-type domain-containing protein n=1 Tax=Fusarium euwallaceae TaxID=1147111 RepID=A0A430M5P4_9HYPO|nr:hypothetical protein BHE90_002113 [Fusarium euwallaceae]
MSLPEPCTMFDSGFDWDSLLLDDPLQPAPDLLHDSTPPSSQGTKRRRDDSEEGEHQCKTCSTWFPTKKALDNHSNHRTCSSLPLLEVDEYDRGITEEMESKLRDRRGKSKVLEWEDLWRTIFPTSQGVVTPDFVPIIEHDEGREQFYQGLSKLEPSMILEVQGILFKALEIHPVEVVRELDHMVKRLSPPAQRMLKLESEAIADEHSVTLSLETTPSAL